MWKIPTRKRLQALKEQDLSNDEMAAYYGCSTKLIEAFLTEYSISEKWEHPYKSTKKPESDLIPEKKRNCLRCQREFDSYGNGNRICIPCKGNETRGNLTKQYEGI